MHHAEWLIQGIIFLEGTPVVSRLNPIQIGQTVSDMIGHDQEAELAAMGAYNAAIGLAHEVRDQATADLLTTILKMEEGHGDWAEKQQVQFEQMSLENYLANQTGGCGIVCMEYNSTQSAINRIGFVGNYLPRQCGIATFTTDLCEAIANEYSDTSCIALPVNDIEAGYAYPPRVRFELAEKDIDSYRRAADFLNINSVDLACLQHEYGIFGGPAGSHFLALLRELRMPVVTTLHTILQDPDPTQRRVLQEVAALSDRVVVISERGAEFLQAVYGVLPEKIDLIPHGIPDVSFVDPSFHKDLFGVEGKMVLLSFGLLSPNKGIETVIAALPAIVAHMLLPA